MGDVESKQTDKPIVKTRKKRCIDYIVESENKKGDNEKIEGVQRWLKEDTLMEKMFNDDNFKGISSHKRLKKEMTEASSQLKMIDWLSVHFDQSIAENDGNDCLIMDVCSGKGFFGCLISHTLSKSHVVLIDKNKKMKMSHIESMNNVTFNIGDIRAFKFSLSEWIRTEFKKYNKTKLILFGTHLCGELSRILVDAFNELSDIGWALFLVPCCYPKRDKIIDKAKELEMETMDYWLKLLQQGVERKKDDDILLECMQIKEMLSEKNHLIRIVRTKMHCNTDTFKDSNKLEYIPPLKKRKL